MAVDALYEEATSKDPIGCLKIHILLHMAVDSKGLFSYLNTQRNSIEKSIRAYVNLIGLSAATLIGLLGSQNSKTCTIQKQRMTVRSQMCFVSH